MWCTVNPPLPPKTHENALHSGLAEDTVSLFRSQFQNAHDMRTTIMCPPTTCNAKRSLARAEPDDQAHAAKRLRRSREFSREFDLFVESEFSRSDSWEDLVQRQQQSMLDGLCYSLPCDDAEHGLDGWQDYASSAAAPAARKRRWVEVGEMKAPAKKVRADVRRIVAEAANAALGGDFKESGKWRKFVPREGLTGRERNCGSGKASGLATGCSKPNSTAAKPPLSPRVATRPAVAATAAYVEGKARLLAMVGKRRC